MDPSKPPPRKRRKISKQNDETKPKRKIKPKSKSKSKTTTQSKSKKPKNNKNNDKQILEKITIMSNINFKKNDTTCFKNLKILTLSMIESNKLILSDTNTPNLESLTIDNIMNGIERFDVTGLKKLKNLDINHTFIDDSLGFQNFMWTCCSNLETFTSYKCCGLDEQIWYLPKIKKIELYRAELLESLVIVYAPKLTNLSIRAAYECNYVRIYNCPQLNYNIFGSLYKEFDSKVQTIDEYFRNEWNKWKNGIYGKKELIENNIISDDEGDDQEDEEDDYDDNISENDFNKSETIRECVDEQLGHESRQSMKLAYNDMIKEILKYNKKEEMKNQPKIYFNCINVSVDQETANHLMSHVRIGCDNIDAVEDDFKQDARSNNRFGYWMQYGIDPDTICDDDDQFDDFW